MYYKGNHYDKISERFVGKKRYKIYRLRFNDIKEVTGKIYLIETVGEKEVKPTKGKKVATLKAPTFKEVAKIKSKLTNPSIL